MRAFPQDPDGKATPDAEDSGEHFTTTVRLDRVDSARLKEIGRPHQRGNLSAQLRHITKEYLARHDAQDASEAA